MRPKRNSFFWNLRKMRLKWNNFFKTYGKWGQKGTGRKENDKVWHKNNLKFFYFYIKNLIILVKSNKLLCKCRFKNENLRKMRLKWNNFFKTYGKWGQKGTAFFKTYGKWGQKGTAFFETYGKWGQKGTAFFWNLRNLRVKIY